MVELRLLTARARVALAGRHGGEPQRRSALKDAVAHFLKADAEDVPNVNFWVALQPSFVWLLAERNGLTFPRLSEKHDAAVVRRQTIGLAMSVFPHHV